MPIDGVVRPLWRAAVFDPCPDSKPRVNRITYEIRVLEAPRERLRSKEVWVVGADRYRIPDEGLPPDFADRRAPYYQALACRSTPTRSSPPVAIRARPAWPA